VRLNDNNEPAKLSSHVNQALRPTSCKSLLSVHMHKAVPTSCERWPLWMQILGHALESAGWHLGMHGAPWSLPLKCTSLTYSSSSGSSSPYTSVTKAYMHQTRSESLSTAPGQRCNKRPVGISRNLQVTCAGQLTCKENCSAQHGMHAAAVRY
jgi:hypothetical protein